MPLLYPLFLNVDGESSFKETIFENRFKIITELKKINPTVYVKNDVLIIKGGKCDNGAIFYPLDLRSSAALLIASIIFGNCTIVDLSYLERGYDSIYDKLQKIGVVFEVIED